MQPSRYPALPSSLSLPPTDVWGPALLRLAVRALVIGALGILAVVFPILATLGCALVIIGSTGRPRQAGVLAALTLGLLLGWVNSIKPVSGDFWWYLDHYRQLATLPLGDYLGQRIGPFTIKAWEPVYYTFSFLLSRATAGTEVALPLGFTLLLYGAIGTALAHLAARLKLDTVQTMTAVLTTLFVIITFTLSTHLMRQELAACLLFCAAMAWYLGARRLALMLGVLACLTHTTTAVPAFALMLTAVCVQRRSPAQRHLFTVLAALLMGALGAAYSYVDMVENELSKQANDGSINVAMYAVDGLLWLVLFALARHQRGFAARFLCTAMVVYTPFLVGLFDQPLAQLRMYFYVDLFRGMAVFCIIRALMQQGLQRPFYPVLVLTGWLYAEVRILKSSLSYGGTLFQHVIFPLFMV